MNKLKQLLIVLGIISIQNSYAQCWINSKTKTTDWRKAGSSNTWDWTQEEFEMYLTNQTGATYVRSPFWVYKGATTNDNPALFDFRKYQTAGQKDFHPEDGWELVEVESENKKLK